MLQIKDLSFSYDNNRVVLDKIDLTLNKGQLVAIKGESGVGKSTLLLILAGLEKKYTGNIVYNDIIINKKDLNSYNYNNVALIFQDHNLIKYLNNYDNLIQASIIRNKKVSLEKVNDYLNKFNLDSLDLKKYPATLSGGQQQRIAIIRALLSDVNIILADEPTASVDEHNALIVMKELKMLAELENKIVVVITHDNDVASYCDKIYYLNKGSLSIKK